MKITMVAPFSIYPKGTVISRILPLGLGIARRNHSVEILMPQNETIDSHWEIYKGCINLRSIPMSTLGNKNGPMNYLKDCLNLKREIDSTTPDVIHLFKPKGYGGICSIAESISEKLNGRDKKHSKGLFLDADDLEGFGGMNDIMDYPLSWKLVFQMQLVNLLFHIWDNCILSSWFF